MADRDAFSKQLMTDTVEAAADLSSYQYRFMKWSSGQATYVSTQGAASIGILQNNPAAAGRSAVIAYGGISELELGGNVSQGDNLTSDTVGRGITATDPDEIVICEALSDGSSGERIPVRFTWIGIASTLGVPGMSLADGKIWIGDASGEAAAFALSGDATMTAGGALTLAKKNIRCAIVHFDSAAVIAMNATPCVILDHSALVSAGTIVATDTLVYHGAILQLDGGTAPYDQNQNTIAKYQTAGGGAAVSLTLANWFNGGADNAMTTLKPIATDVALEADQDIVLTSSASPFAAGGDRALNVAVYYSVYSRV